MNLMQCYHPRSHLTSLGRPGLGASVTCRPAMRSVLLLLPAFGLVFAQVTGSLDVQDIPSKRTKRNDKMTPPKNFHIYLPSNVPSIGQDPRRSQRSGDSFQEVWRNVFWGERQVNIEGNENLLFFPDVSR